jgi:orotidine-5'-phosphate decarboxylase
MTSADPRDHLVLVLDVERLDDALAYAVRMSPWFGIVKVGYELYGAAGPEAFDALHHKGFRVFADLKLHDIPTTVERGARAIGRHGVEFLNFHAAGGETMLRAGLDGLRDGARDE